MKLKEHDCLWEQLVIIIQGKDSWVWPKEYTMTKQLQILKGEAADLKDKEKHEK